MTMGIFSDIVLCCVVVTLLLCGSALSQECPCPAEGKCLDPSSCNSTSSDKLCRNSCPDGYYEVNDTRRNCINPTTSPLVTTTTATNGTETDAPPSTVPPTPVGPSYLVPCSVCHNNCKTCNGSSVNDCLSCKDGFYSVPGTTVGRTFCGDCNDTCKTCNGSSNYDCLSCKDGFRPENSTCVQDDGGLSKEAIIGIAVGVGGGAVVVIIAVVVICCCCRRCRRQRMEPNQEEGGNPVSLGQTAGSRGSSLEREREDKKEEDPVEPRPSKGVDQPTYENYKTPGMRESTIQQGHDKMFRYTRDPTAKANAKAKTRTFKTTSEDEELKHLPPAPRPPTVTPVAPPDDEYEIQDFPGPSTSKEASGSSTTLTKDAKPIKGKNARGGKGTNRAHTQGAADQKGKKGKGERRKTEPNVAKFPVEMAEEEEKVKQEEEENRRKEEEKKEREEAEKKSKREEAEKKRREEAEKKKKREEAEKKKKGEAEKTKREEAEKKPRNFRQPPPLPVNNPPSEDDDEDAPEAGYENESTVNLLYKGESGGSHGFVNPATQADEPEEEYGNQEAIEEELRRRSNGQTGQVYMAMDPLRPSHHGGAAEGGGVTFSNDDDDPQEVYCNVDDEHPYQNVPFTGNKT